MEEKHEAHMMTYALDSNDRLTDIEEVANGSECGCFCPACHEPLIAKNHGMIRIHHFAHQSGSNCKYAYESMLHHLAKEKIQEAFYHNDEFNIELQYQSYCSNYKQCKYIHYNDCCQSVWEKFNLKKYYDSCEQECKYDTINRRSDLKFYSSTNPQREPIYFEFCVTHASDEAKLSSGKKIVEIVITDESDIEALIKNGVKEEWRTTDYGHRIPKISFHGFKSQDHTNTEISSTIAFHRYIWYSSGKFYYKMERCKCKELKKIRQSSILEIAFHTDKYFDNFKLPHYIGYEKLHNPSCMLCSNYVQYYNGNGLICSMYRVLQIPKAEKFDTSRAKTCPCFSFNQKDMDETLHKCHMEYDIL